MLIIDSYTVSLVFSGDFVDLLPTLSLLITDKSTSTKTTKTFKSVFLSNSRFTELEIDWANTLPSGEYYYYLLNDDITLDQGILRVSGTTVNVPIYKDNMEEYKIYKN